MLTQEFGSSLHHLQVLGAFYLNSLNFNFFTSEVEVRLGHSLQDDHDNIV